MKITKPCLIFMSAPVVLMGAAAKPKSGDDVEQLKRAIKHYQAGLQLSGEGRMEAAAAEIQAASQLEPYEAYWHLALAMALEKKGDHQGALTEYQRAGELAPRDSELHLTFEDFLKIQSELGGRASTSAEPREPFGGAYAIGREVKPPIPTYKPEPPYSERARKAKYNGSLALWIVVDAQGNVSRVGVVKPLGLGLDQQAIKAVRGWKFNPATRDGVPVPVHVTVEVTFKLF